MELEIWMVLGKVAAALVVALGLGGLAGKFIAMGMGSDEGEGW